MKKDWFDSYAPIINCDVIKLIVSQHIRSNYLTN